jgi:hypothetical protein
MGFEKVMEDEEEKMGLVVWDWKHTLKINLTNTFKPFYKAFFQIFNFIHGLTVAGHGKYFD